MQGITVNELAAISAIAGAIFGGLLWIINAQLAKIKHETSPNSGGSMKDKIDLTYDLVKDMANVQKEWREEQTRHNNRLYEADKRIHERLDGHIHDHLERLA